MSFTLLSKASLILALLLPFTSLSVAQTARSSQPAKRALLIGIDKYKSAGVTQLRGAVNDVRLMRELLIGKFDMPPENITMLENEQATHKAIIDAIENQLIAKANKDDVVVLHFSGHGSQMPDQSGDEIDQLDETLVPYDSRTEGVFDISDDEINGLLGQLTGKTKNVTFIFDSCHSGAAARGGNTVREIKADSRTPPPPEKFALSVKGREADSNFRLSQSDYVLISGSRAHELSNETDFEGRRHGALTWFFASALKATPARLTYRDIFDEVKVAVTMHFPSQHPEIEGPGQDLTVFGVEKVQAKPYILVEPRNDGTARLEAGKVFGVGKGTTLTVYPPKTIDFEKTTPIATLTIMSVSDFEAEGTLREGKSIPPQSRALLEAVSFGETAIPIFVEKTSSALSEVKAALAQMQAVKLVNDERSARVLVKQHQDTLAVHSGDLEVLVPPVRLENADAVVRVIAQIKDLVHWQVAFELKNPTARIQVGFHVWRASDASTMPPPTVVSSGTELMYRVENNHDQALYIYVLDISSDGSVALLFPRGGQQQLPSGGKIERRLKMSVPSGHVSVTDALKVIATTRQIDPALFPQGPIQSAPQATSKAASDPLSRFLADALRGTRAAVDITVESDSWVTVQKAIQVRQEGARLSSFALHFDGSKTVQDIRSALQRSRSLCSDQEKNTSSACEGVISITEDGSIIELVPGKATRGEDHAVSVGQAFDEAYRLQDQIGARRVEPQFEIQMPRIETERRTGTRDFPGDNIHESAAEADDQWNLKQVRAAEAWKKIRDRLGLPEGREADGIRIAHPDTGYLEHPEIWMEVGGKRPIDVANGHNYYEEGHNAIDPLLGTRWFLDHPGHGTGSGSVIVSPFGCQLRNTKRCVHGIARGAQLIPLRVHRSVSQFNTSYLSRAIRDVADGNKAGRARLMSIAMGGPPTLSMREAVRAAEKNGVLIVAAAGNIVQTVVWPAQFPSVIAVAAGDVLCQPWRHSSNGSAVDIMAPGVSVWRATLDDKHNYSNDMGKGTTFATSHVAGAAALWLSLHRQEPLLETLTKQGLLTETFRAALRSSAWRPAITPNPPGTQCKKEATWDFAYGAGILDIATLLDVSLSSPPDVFSRIEEEAIPLFASLYRRGTNSARVRADYQTLFPSSRGGSVDELSSFETEILFHYTTDEEVQREVNAMVAMQGRVESANAVRRALLREDLSSRLRQALNQ